LFVAYLVSFRRAFTGGPVRNRPSRGGGGTANTNANVARASKGSKKPKTAAELDQELDAFMGDADVVPAGDATAAVPAAGDVDMA
jgi:THO complex subunit 4